MSIHEISSYPLVMYLRARKIANDIADKYCREVRYQTGEKIYYVLDFKNNSGGFESRNEYFKGSSSPKDIRFIENGSKNLAVF